MWNYGGLWKNFIMKVLNLGKWYYFCWFIFWFVCFRYFYIVYVVDENFFFIGGVILNFFYFVGVVVLNLKNLIWKFYIFLVGFILLVFFIFFLIF